MTALPRPTQYQSQMIALFDEPVGWPGGEVGPTAVHEQGRYRLEVWVDRGMHLLRFLYGEVAVCELLCGESRGPAFAEPVASCPCVGEREFEHRFESAGVTYLNTFQTETLGPSLYAGTAEEIREMLGGEGVVGVEWGEGSGQGLAVVEVQRYAREVHAQGYHLDPSTGLVIRTQTIFEHR